MKNNKELQIKMTLGKKTKHTTAILLLRFLLVLIKKQRTHTIAAAMWTLRSCLPVLSSGGNVGCKSWLQKSVRQHSIVRRNCAFGESCWRKIGTFRFWSDQLGQALEILLIQLSRNKSLGHLNLKTQTNKKITVENSSTPSFNAWDLYSGRKVPSNFFGCKC